MSPPKHVAILGGGITGLTAAFHLARRLPKTSRITLVEKSNRLGGWIKSAPITGSKVCLEAGPRAFNTGTDGIAGVIELVNLLNLSSYLRLVPKDSAASKLRYIYLDHAHGISLIPPKTFLFPFFSRFRWSVIPLISELFRGPNKPKGVEDESIDAVLTRRFGSEVARVFASSLVHGIFAADSRELSFQSAFPGLKDAEKLGDGSILKGLPKALAATRGVRAMRLLAMTLEGEGYEMGDLDKVIKQTSSFSFDGGLEMLVRTLEDRVRNEENVEILMGVGASNMEKTTKDSEFEIALSNGSMLTPSHVISTLPLPALDAITLSTNSIKSSPLPNLTANPSATVQVLNLVFSPSQTPLHLPGFGFLIPRPKDGYPTSPIFIREEDNKPILQNILGVVFDSYRDPDFDYKKDPTVITLMMGGSFPLYQPPGFDSEAHPSGTIVSSTLPASSLQIYLDSLAHYLNANIPPPISHALHTHYDCIPTYRPGHEARMKELGEARREGVWGDRLKITGTVMHPSLVSCIRSAREAAIEVASGKDLSTPTGEQVGRADAQ
ncbi:oxygen-dependent protoporphyrinogen oxidase [Tulasnella sp. JGI-2019a]|nr:oxygen-dependent protoporphyrinogen oxidase [Tulasnella sp. JGI-2019a]